MSMDGPQAHDHSPEGSCQQSEVRLGESLSPPEQAHGDKQSGKEGRPESRPRERMQHGGDDGYGKDADPPLRLAGPRYLLFRSASAPCVSMNARLAVRIGFLAFNLLFR